MSKGSKIVPIRVPPLILTAMDRAIKDSNKFRREEPYTRSSWILTQVIAQLHHLERSIKARRKQLANKRAEKS